MRSTRLETLEGRLVTIPNSKFSDNPVENVSLEPSLKVSVNLGLTYDTTPEKMKHAMEILNEIVAWMRTQSGTGSLRAILYMDEIFGYFPPTAEPPSKLPMLTLLKQARAYGLGVVLATQNPVDLDYKGLSNTGTWFLERLQTAISFGALTGRKLGSSRNVGRATTAARTAGRAAREKEDIGRRLVNDDSYRDFHSPTVSPLTTRP